MCYLFICLNSFLKFYYILYLINKRSFFFSYFDFNSINLFCIWGFFLIFKFLLNVLKFSILILINIVISIIFIDFILIFD